jgi:glutathione S-transferase
MSELPATAPLLVWSLPPVWGTPSPSPFVIKLLTWLRMAGIPHEVRALTGPPRSPTGKIPYVQLPDGSLLHDSAFIITELGRRHGVDLDASLTAEQRATGLAVRRMVEESLYFTGLWERWISDAGYAHTARDYFAHMPLIARAVVPAVLRRKIRRDLQGQGTGRHPPETIAAHTRADADALAALLGDKEFMLGAPSTVDASVYGVVTAMTANPWDSFVKQAIEARPNLIAYRERMKARYWG